MPPRIVEARLRDILSAVRQIQRYTDAMSYDQFCADQKTVEAVQLNFIIIGEAARNVPDAIAALHPEIPWKDMRGLRNVVAHGYFSVSLSVLWQTIASDLPPLVDPVEALLKKLEAPSE